MHGTHAWYEANLGHRRERLATAEPAYPALPQVAGAKQRIAFGTTHQDAQPGDQLHLQCSVQLPKPASVCGESGVLESVRQQRFSRELENDDIFGIFGICSAQIALQ